MTIKITRKREMSGGGPGPTVDEMREFLETLEGDKVIHITYYAGDQRDGPSWKFRVDE